MTIVYTQFLVLFVLVCVAVFFSFFSVLRAFKKGREKNEKKRRRFLVTYVFTDTFNYTSLKRAFSSDCYKLPICKHITKFLSIYLQNI